MTTSSTQSSPRERGDSVRTTWIALLVVITAGMALRLAFLLLSHLHVDEYSSIWAALQVLDKGIPLLPSGFPYLQGVLFTYLDALFIGLFGFSEWAARLPSLLCSVLTIAAVYAWGRRAFGPWFGLIAASLTALSPDSIVWGGRARMYALQQALFILAMYAFLRGYVEKAQKPGWRWAFAFLFLGALLSQTITILAVPALIICLLVWRGNWLANKRVLWPLAVVGFGIALAVFLNDLGGPVSDMAERAFMEFSIPWRPKPEYFFREHFWYGPTVTRSLLFIAGFAYLLWSLGRTAFTRRSDRSKASLLETQAQMLRCAQNDEAEVVDDSGARGRVADSPDVNALGVTHLLCLYVVVSSVLLAMIFLVGESWQRPRYLLMLQPIIDLLVVGVLWSFYSSLKCFASLRMARGRNQNRMAEMAGYRLHILGAAIWLCVTAMFLPAAIGTIGPTEPAYDAAFRHILERWTQEDRVVGPLPSIAATYLGRCDGYMLQNGYDEYLIWQDGQPVDRWTGAPLIDSIESFERYFGQQQRVWFAVDNTRWQQRYTSEFRDYIERNMSMAYQAFEITVYQK